MQKFKFTLAAAALITALPLLQGCVPVVIGGAAAGVMSAYDRRSTGVQTDDETAEWKAAQRIPERFKAASHVNFTAYNHRVLITGEVPSDEARTVVGEQTRQVPGVTEVFNELNVAPASAYGNRSNDSYITSKLKARLVDSNQLSANHIKVVTENGVAYSWLESTRPTPAASTAPWSAAAARRPRRRHRLKLANRYRDALI